MVFGSVYETRRGEASKLIWGLGRQQERKEGSWGFDLDGWIDGSM